MARSRLKGNEEACELMVNPDHVAVVIHNYRWRLGLAADHHHGRRRQWRAAGSDLVTTRARGFLRQIVSDAALDGPVRIFAGEFLDVGARLRVRRCRAPVLHQNR